MNPLDVRSLTEEAALRSFQRWGKQESSRGAWFCTNPDEGEARYLGGFADGEYNQADGTRWYFCRERENFFLEDDMSEDDPDFCERCDRLLVLEDEG